MRTSSTTVTVGSGRSIHWGSDCGTMCGAAHRSGRFTEPKLVNAETATCKRCVKIMAAEVETTHAEALTENAKREFAAAAQELKAQDLAASAKLVALVSGSSETAYPEAVKLDTWLIEGLVLVGPATDSLYVFENWGPGGAVLRHVDTGALETVAQADVTEWKYLPGVGSEEILPAEVRVGDVIKFHPEGSYRTISGKVRHEGTNLYSFSIEGSATQFVRTALELVCRKELPARG